MNRVIQLFESMVFNDEIMQDRLPKDIYQALRKTRNQGTHLELDVANVTANAMKDWALEQGATHFTHWFQPMTGITAEKHDAFISSAGSGKVLMEFSGKELVRGEPDASSFPSGGLRATFEARGYTVWDTTSYAFIKDGTLCIPTAFCSYSGEALDKKTPLLRSMEAVDRQAMRILKLFGNHTVKRVISTVGPEQEYFLIDREVYLQRPDLMYTGRTLFGAKPPKGQELDDHYFGTLKPRVSAFMKELDEELWKLGILSKTKHNEVAPAQHELAPIFTTTNIATDHNQLIMELMKRIAAKHNLTCLLHEKPFEGINGSGKHNNWSLAADTGQNLLEPGKTPHENAQFLIFLTAVIKAVDEYQDLLRISVASAGNDHRLGANEAPPAIVSIFLGEELTEILDALVEQHEYQEKQPIQMEIGATVLPHFPKDTTDRNRTSPFAFTGNKFEFRMPGSTLSIAGPNIVLNTIVAESLKQFAEELEKAKDFKKSLDHIIRRTIRTHKRIIFNGNNYSQEWIAEAASRGLLNLPTTADALPCFISQKNLALFSAHHVFTEAEIFSRYEILLEEYCKTLHIEAATMLTLVKQDIFGAVLTYQKELATLVDSKASHTGAGKLETYLLSHISQLSDQLLADVFELETHLAVVETFEGYLQMAEFYKDTLLPDMQKLRASVDALETCTARKYWPLPTCAEILYSVN